jgi:UDP-hydrolysing UDP-N-acetyl-D-glucosamine 2-epimerase
VSEIEADGFNVVERLNTLTDDDTPSGIARSMGNGLRQFGEAYARSELDILLVLGDRYEMFAAAAAAVPYNIPIAHIHGGELTEGAIDDAFRHAITKMSTFHFAATQAYAVRIQQMGEPKDRIFVSGAPGLQNIPYMAQLDLEQLQELVGIPLEQSPIVVTFHPITREVGDAKWQTNQLIAALTNLERPIVITFPNADTERNAIIDILEDFSASSSKASLIRSLGTQGYFSLMRHSAAMVGNSSSGIIEAASFELPVVNIGTRQLGRLRGANVIDCTHEAPAIIDAINRALSDDFREKIRGMTNPYESEDAAGFIAGHLESLPIDRDIIKKSFVDIPIGAG